MIIITGTKRSGTSMWMQLLKEAGIPIIGEAFSKNWEDTIKDANPHGFYESKLRKGVYYATNPDPANGHFLKPKETKLLGVKVFIPGLCRSDMAYLHRVVASCRNWREYCSSLQRLYAMEDAARLEKNPNAKSPRRLAPHLEWWMENYMLIRDIAVRGYPAQMLSYESMLADPEKELSRIFKWVGVGDAAKAAAQVKPSARTQRGSEVEVDVDLEPKFVEVFDEYYDLIHRQKPLPPTFLQKMNETNAELKERTRTELDEVRKFRRAVRAARMAKMKQAENPVDQLAELTERSDD